MIHSLSVVGWLGPSLSPVAIESCWSVSLVATIVFGFGRKMKEPDPGPGSLLNFGSGVGIDGGC